VIQRDHVLHARHQWLGALADVLGGVTPYVTGGPNGTGTPTVFGRASTDQISVLR